MANLSYGKTESPLLPIGIVFRAKRIEIEEWETKNENEQVLSSESLMLGTWFLLMREILLC